MRFRSTAVACLLAFSLPSFATPILENRANGIDQSTYNDLVWYTKYSSAAYQLVCPHPLGNTLVKSFDTGGTQGFIARDDKKKEIVLAFRGSLSVTDALVDIMIIMIPLKATGVTNVGNAYVHTGFQYAYNVVGTAVLDAMKAQVAAYPSYNLVVTGHSLGGSVGSFAALALKEAFPNKPLKLFTFGQPRTGNAAFASLVENRIGVNNIFRAVHTFDGVPTILFEFLGYRHFATEYWNFQEPSSPANVKKCTGGEDPTCSDSIPSLGITVAHPFYFGQALALNPLLCI